MYDKCVSISNRDYTTNMINVTEKELEIIKCLTQGMSIGQISKTLHNAASTIQHQIGGIYDKIESFGYKRTMTQIAVLYIQTPEVFNLVRRTIDIRATKKHIAIKMLKQRIHYKSVADRLEMNSTSTATYKGQLSDKDFYTLPYLHKL
jgi:DNA-binding CsgD family transcriptional regulator